MRKTILIITDNLPTQINGVQTTFKNIEPHATKDGYNIVYIDPSQFPHCNAPLYPEVKLSWPKNIGHLIKSANANYIHIATEGPLGLAANMWCWKHKYKFNTSYHTNFPEFIKKLYGIPESVTYSYVRWFHNHSGKVLTTTQTMVNKLQSHNFKSNIIPWTRGVDRDKLKPSKQWSHVNSPLIVLYVGRVSKEKNLDALCSLHDTYTINIVGDGPDKTRLQKLYPTVNFLGYKSGTQLADHYSQADIFAFPSKTDTFGIVMIEALSLGTPVAAYPVPGPIDIIQHGITGFMHTNLKYAITQCTTLDRTTVKNLSHNWSWETTWQIFRDNLITTT